MGVKHDGVKCPTCVCDVSVSWLENITDFPMIKPLCSHIGPSGVKKAIGSFVTLTPPPAAAAEYR